MMSRANEPGSLPLNAGASLEEQRTTGGAGPCPIRHATDTECSPAGWST